MEETKKTTTATKEPEAAAVETVNIDLSHIHPHPDNPRKELGDLTEMVESIRKNGVMQNLTVIPDEKHPGEYITLIGHRRRAAAEKAGIASLPCRIIEGLTKKDQVGIMLEENMQRADLTIFEQAQGFQMMLDLGETKESIAEKTGFSMTTIKHRLNIAKLDKRVLRSREKDEAFQLSISDLYELEKVESIKKRNEILKEARDSRDLAWKAKQAADEERRDKTAKAIIELATKRGIVEATDYLNHRWDGTYETVKLIDLDEPAPKRLRIGDDDTGLMYARSFREIYIVKKSKKKKSQNTQQSEWEKERKRVDKVRKDIKALYKNMLAGMKDFIKSIIDGKTEELKDTTEVIPLLWDALVTNETYLNKNRLSKYITGKNSWELSEEEKQTVKTAMEGLPMIHQMLILLTGSIGDVEMADYNGYFKQADANKVKKVMAPLELYGYTPATEEEKQLIDGTLPLYEQKKK